MARPTKQGMDYFPHDTDASNDEKLEALRILYGNDGYAFYFILLERIYRTPDFELDVSDAETIQILAKKVEVTKDKFSEMLNTAIKRGCFCKEAFETRQVLTSNGIKKRSLSVIQKRESMANAYKKSKNKDSSPASKDVSDAETIPETIPETPVSDELPSRVKESKVKESKVEESKVDINSEKTISKNVSKPKDLQEVVDYFKQLGIKNAEYNANKFFNHYDSSNWTRNKTKIKKWKACVKTWDLEYETTGSHVPKTPGKHQNSLSIAEYQKLFSA
jgi:hypothetical protein